MKVKRKILEDLAALEHDQWVHWAKDIAETEDITPERVEKWKKLFVPYNELSEDDKDKDREWVVKVLKIIAKNL